MTTYEQSMAEALYAQGYRLHSKYVGDDYTLYVMTKDGKVTDVYMRPAGEPEIMKAAFKKGSWGDNFSLIQGWNDDKVFPMRCVEIAVFLQVKLHEVMYQVQKCTDESMRDALMKSANAIPTKVLELIKKKPALDKDDDDVVAVCKVWPTTELDETLSFEDLKKAWLARHKPLLGCRQTDPKIAKLGVGRGLPGAFLSRFFDARFGLADEAVTFTRLALLMANKCLCGLALLTGACEEMSHDDNIWAAQIIPEATGDAGALDFFKVSTPENETVCSTVISHVLTKAPEKRLGICNGRVRELAVKTLVGEDFDVTPGMHALMEIGWDKWWNEKQGFEVQDVFKPTPLFPVDGYITEPVSLEAVFKILARL